MDVRSSVADHSEDRRNERDRTNLTTPIEQPISLQDTERTRILSPPLRPLSPSEPTSPLASLEDLVALASRSPLDSIQREMSFITRLRSATLDDGVGLKGHALDRLRNPPTTPLEIDCKKELLALRMLEAVEHAPEDTFYKIRDAINECFATAIPSFEGTKDTLATLTGIEAVHDDMCVRSCAAFTGDWADLDECPDCGEPRYNQEKLQQSNGRKKVPRVQCTTYLLGPQIQTLWRHQESARKMHYKHNRIREIIEEIRQSPQRLPRVYDDVFTGSAFLDDLRSGKIKMDDTFVMLSIDGAQLTEKKASSVTIYTWIVLDLSPEHRYKKRYVLPGGVIPGPNKPKFLSSFLFTGMHHVSALQKEPMPLWDASTGRLFDSFLFVVLVLADGPGLISYSNMVGHGGKYGCRMNCELYGRRITGSVYYPALLAPNNWVCDARGDIDPWSISASSSARYVEKLKIVMGSHTLASFARNRLETGIVGPSLLLGLQPDKILGIPENFTSELMHYTGANMPSLWVNLWRGSKTLVHATDDVNTWGWAVLQGDTWVAHGALVVAAHEHIPSSHGKLPRNPEQAWNSGYKAQENNVWIYGLCPGLLFGVLPFEYWQNFCRFVKGIRIMHQCSITPAQLDDARRTLIDWELEFEELYYRQQKNRLHFVRPCVHLTHHLAAEAARVGSPICSSQYPMERTIGNLKEEMRQPSNPFANLAERGLLRAQMNALKAMYPSLAPSKDERDPTGSVSLGGGYTFLFKKDKKSLGSLRECERAIILEFTRVALVRIIRWARLKLPTGQIARSLWGESLNTRCTRRSRNVKILYEGEDRFAEIFYFVQLPLVLPNGDFHEDETSRMALVSIYSQPHAAVLGLSHGQLVSCSHTGDAALRLIDVKTIKSVVAMIPHKLTPLGDETTRYFAMEKLGLDVLRIGGMDEPEETGANDGLVINEDDY
ncbi:hypothetical protein CONPUDRAFT_59151 [Coniophora puteana RWD-64-598 SS2]|uniref:Uncharacterized protein n=1 Tax=Coniophora puteana (strain RWD-64-598) TaxID=741705 RepID=A0A5M3MIE2_CONPW|nr:uncharacterized protein CONPUDRAFT_59151 [Coniophora puteana RWD-64-598 SS2]EIW78817.1 hypothetical protein CONPUDRAFT_59151 [Coniophora puteana RWD-64-598 SS2]